MLMNKYIKNSVPLQLHSQTHRHTQGHIHSQTQRTQSHSISLDHSPPFNTLKAILMTKSSWDHSLCSYTCRYMLGMNFHACVYMYFYVYIVVSFVCEFSYLHMCAAILAPALCMSMSYVCSLILPAPLVMLTPLPLSR